VSFIQSALKQSKLRSVGRAFLRHGPTADGVLHDAWVSFCRDLYESFPVTRRASS